MARASPSSTARFQVQATTVRETITWYAVRFAPDPGREKILEAAAFGRPIVATAVGGEGLDVRKGRELLVEEGSSGPCRGLPAAAAG
jgi:hypothetical protein